MLIVQNLTKIFKDTTAVDNITFSISPGKIFGLLGPNGAGKTTTIRTVLNIIKPTSGFIRFDDKPINKDFFNLIGYLPEERGLYKKSKVINTIIYFAGLKNLDKKVAFDESIKWLKKLEIEKFKDKKIEELSKGNQQKVQFITAIIHNPKLLILDEPFSGFDPINQQLIKEILISFVNSGKIIMLSTHQMDTAEKLCSDILLMNKGKDVCSGSLSKIKKKFGTNNIKIEFSGDISFLNSHPSIIHIDSYSNYAEIQLRDDVYPADFLRSVVNRVNVTHFSVIEPTLNKIFIDAIKQNIN
ncbi:MAG: ATP-binding cassette domain-containing protein [Bacteroidetes bacterium]|nr:ATP-binding cassette domain-containing protein [Bacteroidota bacterium]